MMEQQNTPVALEETAVQELVSRMRGELLRPGDVGYEEAHQVYNGMIDKRSALIACCLDVADVIQELSQAMQRERRVPDLLPFYQAALNREFLVSSEMEEGMAFPHARLPGLKELSFAFGRSDGPLRWGTRGAHAVRMVFLLAVPATDSTQYLLVISGLARLAKAPHLVEQLLGAQDIVQILDVLTQIKLRNRSAPDALDKAMTQ